MALSVDSRLGPYEISGPLGAGGMGEVYRARDTRLGRDVAVKVLPQMLSKDEERLRRFEQEARAAGALNHPNILTIFDVGSHEGAPYVVSELLEGATLGEELRNGPLPVRKALDYAAQLARGLAAAHEKGIFHRDLKPDNVFVTTDGRIKILDFGLAKLSETFTDPARSGLPTAAATDAGVVLGTVGYMSPEQVRGLTVDHRADIFSFGAVLYEMLSGRRAFLGDSSVETMNAILKEDPPEIANDVNRTLPPAVDRVVRHCLEKKAEQRFQSARDLAFALEALSTGSGSVLTTTSIQPDLRPKRRWMAVAAVLILLGALAIVGNRSLRVEPEPAWSGVLLGGPEIAFTPRISPDGKTLAFLAMVNNLSQVAVMDPANGDWRILTTDRSHGFVRQLNWSADGSRIYFDRVYSSISVFSVPVLGGDERQVLEGASAPNPLPDGSLILVRRNEQRIPELYHFWPESGRLDRLGAYIDDFGNTVRVSQDGREVAFPGRLVESASNELFAGDISSRQFRAIAPQVSLGGGATPLWPLAPDRQTGGWLTAQKSGDLLGIVRIPRGGGEFRTLIVLTQNFRSLDSGPDGSLYLDQPDRPREVIRFGAEGGTPEHLAYSSRFQREEIAILSDGRTLFEMEFSGRTRLVAARPGERAFPLVETPEETLGPAIQISAEQVACLIGRGPNQTIAIVSIKNGQIVRRLKGTLGKTIAALAASPDGKTLYFVESQSVWAIPASDGEPRRLGAGDGMAPSPDGRYLVVQLNETNEIRLAKLNVVGGEPEPIPLTLGDLRLRTLLSPNAVAPDGRILMAVGSPDSWFESVGIIDPRTGTVKRVPTNFTGDIHAPGWTKDGRIVASALPMRSSLWRFRPEK